MIIGDKQGLAGEGVARRPKQACLIMLSASVAVIALEAAPVLAQDATTQSSVAGTAPFALAAVPEANLSDIIVTARRRGENLEKVPVAVTAFSAADLQTKHVNDAVSLATFSPSMVSGTVNSNADAPSFAIRGQATTQFGAPGVVSYFAEVPVSFFGLSPVDGRPGSYYDLANVQILNGPQGTLFGKNATGGSVLFVPNKPTNRFEGYLQAEGGSYNDRRIQGAINIPIISDKVLLRIAGELDRRDGYVKDVGPYFPGKDYNNVHDESFRVSLTLRPVDGLENTTIARYFHQATNGPGYFFAALNPQSPPAGFAFLFPGILNYANVAQANGIRHASYNLDQSNRYNYWQAVNTTAYEVAKGLTLKNIFSYAQDREKLTYSLDGSPYSLFQIITPSGGHYYAANLLTEELQLQGRLLNDSLTFSFGGYYDKQSDDDPKFTSILVPLNFLFGGNQFVPLQTYGYFDTTSHAVFGQATYDLGKSIDALQGLSLTGGYRHTWEKVTSNYFLDKVPNQGPAVNTNSFDYGSYTVGVDYQVTSHLLTYIVARSATKSGGSNLYQPLGSPYLNFSPERLDDVELGVKSQFRVLGAPATINYALYTGKYKDVQRSVDVVYQGVPAFITLNTSRARIRGFEFSANLTPVRNLDLTASWAYIDAKYKGATNVAGTVLAQGAFPYTPKHKVTVGGTYSVLLVHVGEKLSFNAVYTYQTREGVADTEPSFIQTIPSTKLINARITWANFAGRPVDLAFFMTNVGNKAYVTAVNDGYYKPYGAVSYLYNEPRMYGAQLTYHF